MKTTDIQEVRAKEAKVRVQGSLDACRLTLTKGLDFFKSSRGEIDDLQLAIDAIERSNPQIKYLAGLDLKGQLMPVRWLGDVENRKDCKILVVCRDQAMLAAEFFPNLVVLGFGTLLDVLEFADSSYPLTPPPYVEQPLDLPELPPHLQDAFAQASEVIASGKNVVLTFEKPGTGATMIARRLVSALGPLSHEHAIEISRIYANLGLTRTLLRCRSFRSPHHTVSDQGLFGKAQNDQHAARAGECHLATHGILFLDEGPEFRRSAVREVFRLQRERQVFRVVVGWHVTKHSPVPGAELLAQWNAVEVKITR
jgi:predicted ATPase with chaperone activity